jgi:ubiquinone/menaquinone biosynthesis C-methylase UbiE
MAWNRQAVASLTDEQWQDVLVRSVDSPLVDGVRLPGFPPSEIQRQFNGEAGAPVVRRAYTLYQYIKQQAAQLGAPIRPASRILDFGVGWGRVLRVFLKDVEPQGLFGADVSAMILQACRDTGLPATLAQIAPRGVLPFRDSFFDCVYANSVFTHLPEPVQNVWLAEIARALRPGGAFIATVEPPRFLEFALSASAVNSANAWHQQLARAVARVPHAKEQFARRGFVFIPTNTPPEEPWEDATYGDSVCSEGYVRKYWGAWFRVHSYLDEQKRFQQAVVVCQKPDGR